MAGFAFPAFAQQAAQPAQQAAAQQGGLEEIVVTAERREEKLRALYALRRERRQPGATE